MAGLVGVLGSRSLPSSWGPAVASVVAAVAGSGASVVTSCCHSGAPALARSACAALGVAPVVHSASLPGPAGLAARAAALVRSLVGSGSAVVFVAGPCPAGVVPARSWRSGAVPSGSWSELALAVGLGVPVVVVWAGSGPAALPAWPGGSWVPASAPGGLAGFAWSPAAVQPSLF